MNRLILIASAFTTAAALHSASSIAVGETASTFPNKPIRLVLPGTGQIDGIARTIGPRLSERFAQPIVLEHTAGASGILAANRVAKATPDGHSLLLATTGFAVSAALHSNLPYDPRQDFVGVAQIAIPTTVLVAAPMLGLRSVSELVAAAKASPRKIIFGSPGPGSGPHLLGERLRLASGIDVVHVGINSSQLLIETATGRIHYCFLPLGPVLPLVKSGKLTALAVTTPQSHLLPNVPSIADAIPDFVKPIGSFGLLAPGRTPREVVRKIGKEVVAILNISEVDEWMRSEGLMPAPALPDAYDRILHAQIAAFAELIRNAGIPKR